MNLYAENNQNIRCYKTNTPKINNKKSGWNYLTVVVDERKVKFYYSDRYPSDVSSLFSGKRVSGGYFYFQLDSQWYKLDAAQEVFYLGKRRFVNDYVVASDN